jgi:beta-1,4-galactosyltransferase 4
MLTVIVPYRDRRKHLQRFVPEIDLWLKKQRQEYELLVIEQGNDHPFNRGMLMNIGYHLRSDQSTHIVTHDVDMIPQKSGCSTCGTDYAIHGSYRFEQGVIHMAGRTSQFGYKMPYKDYTGGVVKFDNATFEQINGYSNDFWGWGAEDDELRARIERLGIKIQRRDYKYLSLYHRRSMNQQLYSNNVKLLDQDHSGGLDKCRFDVIEEKVFKSSRIITVDFPYL